MHLNTLTYEAREAIAVIGIHRPQQMNALNQELFQELSRLLEQIAHDAEIGAVVLHGAEKFFAAGADLGEIDQLTCLVEAAPFAELAQGVVRQLAELPQPTVAAVSGLALGGGCELCLACDIRFAAENASFGLPEVKLGLLPGAGGTQRLPRLVGPGLAKELLFTGAPLDAESAHRIGLVNRVVPTDQLMDAALAFAGRLAAQPRTALQTIKRLVNDGLDSGLPAALTLETTGFTALFGTEDQKEGVRAFVEKRKPQYSGR